MTPLNWKCSLRVANAHRDIEWNTGGNITASFRAMELAGETGEACNEVKKLERERLGIRGTRSTLDKLAEELADVVICADLLAMHYGIDLDRAVQDKFNATSEKMGLNTRLGPASPPRGGLGMRVFIDECSAIERGTWDRISARLGRQVITDDVRETLRAVEWGGTWNGGAGASYPCCPFCNALKVEGQHTEDCRVMLLLARTEVPR